MSGRLPLRNGATVSYDTVVIDKDLPPGPERRSEAQGGL